VYLREDYLLTEAHWGGIVMPPVIELDKAYAITYCWCVDHSLNQSEIMPTIKATEARSKLYRLIDEAASSHEPIIIKGKRHSAVLISEDDWRAIQDSWYAGINSGRVSHSHRGMHSGT
jgi:PHD/YefM family antitoxin component YafN of YafNO toxin-antitoxin module